MMQWRWTRISDHRESTFGGEPVDGRLQAGHHLLGHDLVVAVDVIRVQMPRRQSWPAAGCDRPDR